MSDFESELEATLARNAEAAQRRVEAEAEMDRVVADKAEEERRLAEEQAAQRSARHAELAEHLQSLAAQLKRSAPDAFVVRVGWTESGEELIAKLSTRQTTPARSLFIELDRDDDEVLARWTSDLGSAVEMWRLLEVDRGVLTRLVLQVADAEQWRGQRPPPFPARPG